MNTLNKFLLAIVLLCSFVIAPVSAPFAAYPTPEPKIQFFDNSGNVLTGGKLYSYAAGTLTPKTTYTDAAAGTPNANPVVLDSAGRAGVWLTTGAYKLILKTSADVTIWTVDNVPGSGYFAGDVTIAGNLSVTGTSTLTGNTTVGGTLGVSGATTGTSLTLTTPLAVTSGGTAATTAATARTSLGVGIYAFTKFDVAGNFTTSANSTTSTVDRYRIIGGGGGGGGANGAGAVGGGGGAGAYAEGIFTSVAANTVIAVTVGAGGTAGSTAGGNGGTGASSSIGSPVSVTANGGNGGLGNTAAGATGAEGGIGGTITGSPSIAIAGQHGGRGWSTAASVGTAGFGGSTPLGGGGIGGSVSVAQSPYTATGYGSGGGGAFLTTTAGGTGATGIVIIEQMTE